MAADPQLAARVIAISGRLQQLGGQMMDRAQELLDAGTLDVEHYFAVQKRYQTIFQQATELCYQTDQLIVESLATALPPLEKAITDLEQSFARLQRIQDILALSIKLLVAVGSVVAALLNPTGTSIPAALQNLADATKTVIEFSRQTSTAKPIP